MKHQRLGRALRLALTLCLLVVMAASMGAHTRAIELPSRATAILPGTGVAQAQDSVAATVLDSQIMLEKLPDEQTVLSGSDVRSTLAVTNAGAVFPINVTVTYPPTILSTALTEAVSGRWYIYDVDASGEPAPTYTLIVHPVGMTIDPNTGVISWLPMVADEGTHMVGVMAQNSAGFDTQTFTLNVSEGTICPDDMIAYWPLNETAGSSYDDLYDGHTGACAGTCPTPADGKIGGAQSFGGLTGISVSRHSDFDWGANDSFTVEFWMKRGGTLSANEVIVGRDAKPSSKLQWWVGLWEESGQGKAVFYVVDTDGHDALVLGTSDLTDDLWHHVVAVRDAAADELYLYVDGQEPTSVSASDIHSLDSNTATLNVGWLNRLGTDGFHYAGLVDEAALYGRALSLAEIQAHAAADGSGPGYCINPNITVVKTANRMFAYVGDSVTYSYTLTNPGNDPLSDLEIEDDKCDLVSFLGGDGNADTELGTDETWTYRCVTNIYVDTTNTVVVTGTSSLGGFLTSVDTFHVNVVHSALSVAKEADSETVYAGETAVYTYTVTNGGDDPLTQVLTVDDACGPPGGVPGDALPVHSGDGNGNNQLDIGEVWIYTCSTKLSADTTNTVTVTVVDSTKRSLTATATAFVDVIGPQLAIVKIADPAIIRVGETTTYSYTVTNPGDDSLSGLTVGDSLCSPLTSLGGDGNGNTLLDPGEVWSYRCTATLTADAASVATATAVDSRGIYIFAQDTASVRVIDPQIALSTAADATTITAGETVRYTYHVTNPGDDPLDDVAVSDDTCAPVNKVSGDGNNNNKLDPGETWLLDCSVALFEDTTNTATATGVDSTSRSVDSAPSGVTVQVKAVAAYSIYVPINMY